MEKIKTASFRYSGAIDRALRFIEKVQLKDRALWDSVISVFYKGRDTDGWRGEYFGKLMRGGVSVYQYTRDEELYDTLTYAVKKLLMTEDGLGRISAYALEHELTDWDVWSRKYVMYGLIYYLDICREQTLYEMTKATLIRHADYIIGKIGRREDGKTEIVKTASFWLGVNSASILRPFVMLCKLTGEKRYLDFSEYIISTGGVDNISLIEVAQKLEYYDFAEYVSSLGCVKEGNLIELASEDRVLPYQYPETKAYETISFFEGVFEYATLKNDKRLMDACLKFGERVLETDYTIVGAVGCYDEIFNNSTKNQVRYTSKHMQETCVVVTLVEYLSRLYEYSSDVRYIDYIERSIYNAFLGAVNYNYGENGGLPFDSYSPLINNRRGLLVAGKQTLPDGAYYGCCAAIGSMGFRAPTSLGVTEYDKGIKISIYESATIGYKNAKITLKTDYPFDEKILLNIDEADGSEFEITLRIPTWSCEYSLSVNGKKLDTPLTNGAVTLKLAWRKGDTVELMLDMPFIYHPSEKFDPSVSDRFAITRGPVVYAAESVVGSLGASGIGDISFEKLDDDGALSSYYATAKSAELTLCNYSSAGLDWKTNITVWLKK